MDSQFGSFLFPYIHQGNLLIVSLHILAIGKDKQHIIETLDAIVATFVEILNVEPVFLTQLVVDRNRVKHTVDSAFLPFVQTSTCIPFSSVIISFTPTMSFPRHLLVRYLNPNILELFLITSGLLGRVLQGVQ